MTTILDFFQNIKTTAISIGFNDILEIIILAFLAYQIIIWLKDSRAVFVIKGIIVILVFFVVATILQLNTILYIAKACLDILVIALLVIFQPELRGALERLGKNNVLAKFFSRGKPTASISEKTRDAIVDAAFDLASTKTGALIVFEKDIPLTEYIRKGIKIDAKITKQLIENIFVHNTPLHDGAVIISDDRIAAAMCILPVSNNPNISKALGTRHRAAIGLSETADSLILIVSEETGHVSVAKEGKLIENLDYAQLRNELNNFLGIDAVADKKKAKEVDNEETNS